MDFGSIDIDFRKISDDNGSSYEIKIDLYSSYTTVHSYNKKCSVTCGLSSSCITAHVEMSKADLKKFHNMISNLLLDLNEEIGIGEYYG